MPKYIALQNIDTFKKGDEVPAEKAELWNQMYRLKPCALVEEEEASRKEAAKPAEPPVREKKSVKGVFGAKKGR